MVKRKQLENRILYDEKAVISQPKIKRSYYVHFAAERSNAHRLIPLMAKSILCLKQQEGDNNHETN